MKLLRLAAKAAYRTALRYASIRVIRMRSSETAACGAAAAGNLLRMLAASVSASSAFS